ncbi:hypothetical protein PVK06_019270 [Gossypium arboreum]|uniref:Uncharacterized protein n=1 Tax=Gossypium arboreum TaxID=29729 RepID=A0ABR0PJ99_GOSAR|nr:hypothetical protein PVK06_019270 [Gossypium arboreum]
MGLLSRTTVVGWLPVCVFCHVCDGANQSGRILSKQDVSADEDLVWIEEIALLARFIEMGWVLCLSEDRALKVNNGLDICFCPQIFIWGALCSLASF